MNTLRLARLLVSAHYLAHSHRPRTDAQRLSEARLTAIMEAAFWLGLSHSVSHVSQELKAAIREAGDKPDYHPANNRAEELFLENLALSFAKRMGWNQV